MNANFKNKAVAAVSAGLLALSMAPVSALAESGSKYISDITVNGMSAGDTVTAYEIVDSVVDANNNKTNNTKDALGTYPPSGDFETYVASLPLSTIQAAAYGTPQTGTADASGSYTFTGLDDGTWLIVITPKDGSANEYVYKNIVVNNDAKANGLDYTANGQTVNAKKTEYPDNANKKIDDTKVEVGETHKFTVTFTVPSYPAAATNKTLTVTDTPTNFEDDASTIEIKNGETTLTSGADYSVTTNSETKGFTINFSSDYVGQHGGQSLTLTYSGKLVKADAVTGGASNTVTVNGSSDDEKVTTYGYVFQKLGGDTNAALEGAEFTIKDSDGNAYATATSDSNGYVVFTGLKQDKTYTISETKVPAGYQKINDFTITPATNWNADNPATSDVKETNFNTDTVTKTDAKQGVLPTTGGAGTIGLTVAGVVLVAGGATVILRARKNQE